MCLSDNDEMKDQLQFMLSQLSQDELETAARSSFAYLKKKTTKNDPCADDANDDPEPYAKRMAERYLKSKRDPHLALEKMKETIAFRQDIDIDGIRLAFDSDQETGYAEPLEQFLRSGKNYVMCHDKQGRATHIFVPRNTVEHDSEWTIKESLYTMERAIASSHAPDQSVNAILDFSGFSPFQHVPPLSLGKEFVLTLRKHYAGQVHRIFIVDAPSTFYYLWKIFQPFLGTNTKEKIIFVNGNEEKQTILSQYYTPEQAAEWMLPENGKKNRELDLQEYLYKTPFDQAFDES